jgi:hypothetical protein
LQTRLDTVASVVDFEIFGGRMRRAVTRLFVLVVSVFSVVSLVAPSTVLAKPKPAKYVLVSETKGCLVTLNGETGRLTFQAEKGHHGKFVVVVRHGQTTRAYHFTARQPKPGQSLPATPVVVPVSTPTGRPIVIIPIPIRGHTRPAGPSGGAPSPTRPTTTDPPPPPKPAASVPRNVAPVLHVNGGVISWSPDKGADTFEGAVSTAPRNAAGRTTTYMNLGIVTSWKPATPACGTTVYYGVASEGQAGERWTANEVAIAGPKCAPPPIENVAPTLTYQLAPNGPYEPALVWPQDPGATSYKAAICTAARGTPGRSCTYIEDIGSPGPPFVGEPQGLMHWDLGDPVAAPCGTHWFSIASEGLAGELWAAQEYSFGPAYFNVSLPACPPPEVNGPPVGEHVFSTNPEDQCAAAINVINQDDGASLPFGGIGYLAVLPPMVECQTMRDLAAPSNDGVLGPVSTINQDHLCEDWATVINEATEFIRGWYVGSTGNCDVVTPTGLYIQAFNGSMASGNGLDAVPDYARSAAYVYPLPWTTAVVN